MNIKISCKCGNEFETTEKRILDGRGKFCSQACKYKYRVMPKRGKGKYVLVKDNSTSFKKGHNTWNKNIKTGIIPHNYKGNDVGYDALHDWVKKYRGKATQCENCGSDKNVQWANKSHDYKRDLSDWLSLCRKCHMAYDKKCGHWGTATKKFKLSKPKNA